MILYPILVILITILYDNNEARHIDSRRRHRSFDPKIFTTCIDSLGCVDVSEKWYDEVYRPRNLEPLDRHTIRTEFILMKSSQNDTKDLVYDILQLKRETIEISGFKKGACTKFMIHDFTSNGRTGWVKHLVGAFAQHTNCNLVSIDWEAGAEPPFEQAVVNARIVALEAIAMINMIKANFSQGIEMIQIIGHGVGAHIAGYIGKNISGLGRITALDPTGPYFEQMSKDVRLDYTDANYVEVIHTDAYGKKSQGASTQLGHVDFYVNNAGHQPGCKDSTILFTDIKRDGLKEGHILPACSHKRSFKYYIESIENTHCQFMGIRCKNFEEFEKGRCFSCANNSCLSFGLNAPAFASTWNHSYYLIAHDKKPYCVLAYTVTMVIDTNTKGKEVEGFFEMILVDVNNTIANATTANSQFKYRMLKPGGRYEFLFYTSPPRLDVIKEAKVKWTKKSSKLCIFCTTSVYVSQIEIKPLLEVEHANATISYLCPQKDTTEIEHGDYVTFKLCNTKSSCPPLITTPAAASNNETTQFVSYQEISKQIQIAQETVKAAQANPQAAHGGFNQIQIANNSDSFESTTNFKMELTIGTTVYTESSTLTLPEQTTISSEEIHTNSYYDTSDTSLKVPVTSNSIDTMVSKFEITMDQSEESKSSGQQQIDSTTHHPEVENHFASTNRLELYSHDLKTSTGSFETSTSETGHNFNETTTNRLEGATSVVNSFNETTTNRLEKVTFIIDVVNNLITTTHLEPSISETEAETSSYDRHGSFGNLETTLNDIKTERILTNDFPFPISSSTYQNFIEQAKVSCSTTSSTKSTAFNDTLLASDIESMCGKLKEAAGTNAPLIFAPTANDLTSPTINEYLLEIKQAHVFKENPYSKNDDVVINVSGEAASNVLPSLEDWRLIRRNDGRPRKNIDFNKLKKIGVRKKASNELLRDQKRNKRKKMNRKQAMKATTEVQCEIDPNTCAEIKSEVDINYDKVKSTLKDVVGAESGLKTSAAHSEQNSLDIESKLDENQYYIMNVSDEQCNAEFGFGREFITPTGDEGNIKFTKSKEKIELKEDETSNNLVGAANVQNSEFRINITTPDCKDDKSLFLNDIKLKEHLHNAINALKEVKLKAIEENILHEKEELNSPKVGAANASFGMKSSNDELCAADDLEDQSTNSKANDDFNMKSKSKERIEYKTTMAARVGAAKALQSSQNVNMDSTDSEGTTHQMYGDDSSGVNNTDEDSLIKSTANKLVQKVTNPLFNKDSGYFVNKSFESSFESAIANNRCEAINSDTFTFKDDDILNNVGTTKKSKRIDQLTNKIGPNDFKSATIVESNKPISTAQMDNDLFEAICNDTEDVFVKAQLAEVKQITKPPHVGAAMIKSDEDESSKTIHFTDDDSDVVKTVSMEGNSVENASDIINFQIKERLKLKSTTRKITTANRIVEKPDFTIEEFTERQLFETVPLSGSIISNATEIIDFNIKEKIKSKISTTEQIMATLDDLAERTFFTTDPTKSTVNEDNSAITGSEIDNAITEHSCMDNLDEILMKLETSLAEILAIKAFNKTNVGLNNNTMDQFKVEAGQCFCYGDLKNVTPNEFTNDFDRATTKVFDINNNDIKKPPEALITQTNMNVAEPETTCFTMLQMAAEGLTFGEEQPTTIILQTEGEEIYSVTSMNQTDLITSQGVETTFSSTALKNLMDVSTVIPFLGVEETSVEIMPHSFAIDEASTTKEAFFKSTIETETDFKHIQYKTTDFLLPEETTRRMISEVPTFLTVASTIQEITTTFTTFKEEMPTSTVLITAEKLDTTEPTIFNNVVVPTSISLATTGILHLINETTVLNDKNLVSKVTETSAKMANDASRFTIGQANVEMARITVDLPVIEVNDGKSTELLILQQQQHLTTTPPNIKSNTIHATQYTANVGVDVSHVALCDSNLSSKINDSDGEIDLYVEKGKNSSSIEVEAKPHSGAVQSDRSFMILDQPNTSTISSDELYKAIEMCSDIRNRRKVKRSDQPAGKYIVNVGHGSKLVPMKVVFDLKENGQIVGTTEYNIVHQDDKLPSSSSSSGGVKSMQKKDRQSKINTFGLANNKTKITITVESIASSNNRSNNFNMSCFNMNRLSNQTVPSVVDNEHCNAIYEHLKNMSDYKVAANNPSEENDTCCFDMKDLSKVYHQPLQFETDDGDAKEVRQQKQQHKRKYVNDDADDSYLLDDFVAKSKDFNSKMIGLHDIDIKPQFYKLYEPGYDRFLLAAPKTEEPFVKWLNESLHDINCDSNSAATNSPLNVSGTEDQQTFIVPLVMKMNESQSGNIGGTTGGQQAFTIDPVQLKYCSDLMEEASNLQKIEKPKINQIAVQGGVSSVESTSLFCTHPTTVQNENTSEHNSLEIKQQIDTSSHANLNQNASTLFTHPTPTEQTTILHTEEYNRINTSTTLEEIQIFPQFINQSQDKLSNGSVDTFTFILTNSDERTTTAILQETICETKIIKICNTHAPIRPKRIDEEPLNENDDMISYECTTPRYYNKLKYKRVVVGHVDRPYRRTRDRRRRHYKKWRGH